MINKLTVSDYKLFCINEKKYIYNIISGSIFEIDDLAIWILSCNGMPINEFKEIVSKRDDSDKIIPLLNALTKEGLIRSNNAELKEMIISKGSLSALTLMVAQECNLRCKYCYGEGGEYSNKGKMTIETAKAAIDFLVSNSETDELKLAFLGGEPLMNMPVIIESVNYCHEIEKRTAKKFSYNITTNAILLTDEIQDFIIKNNIICQISIDGDKNSNDINRLAIDGRGSYDKIVSNTELLRNKHLVSARATLSAQNMNYNNIFNHLHSLEFRAIPMAVAQNTINNTDYEKLLQNYEEYIDYFEILLRSKDLKKAGKMTDLINGLEKIEYSCERNEGCGAGRYMRAVDIDGTMYPCHRFVGNAQYTLGSIFTGEKTNPKSDELIFGKKERCCSCWCRNLCLGGCHYENASANNDNGISMRICKMTQLMYEKLINIYLSIDPDTMNKIRYFYEHRYNQKSVSFE